MNVTIPKLNLHSREPKIIAFNDLSNFGDS